MTITTFQQQVHFCVHVEWVLRIVAMDQIRPPDLEVSAQHDSDSQQ